MLKQDLELLSRVHQVNQQAGAITLQLLNVIADDDALSDAFDEIGYLYAQLGAAFATRAGELRRTIGELGR